MHGAAYNGVDQGKCEGQYGCCFDDSQPTTVGTGGAPLQIPICYYKNGGDSSYTLGGLEDGPGERGILALSKPKTQSAPVACRQIFRATRHLHADLLKLLSHDLFCLVVFLIFQGLD